IGWYFQRKKKWTKALRWYDRALASFPTYHLCRFRRGYCLEKLHRPRETVEALTRARDIWEKAPSEQRQRGRGVQVQVLFHLSRGAVADLGRGRCQARVSGDLRGAASALVEAVRRVPAAEPLVRVELARIELAVGRRTAALRQVERALACRREGGFAEGLRLAADICAQLGRAPDAHRYLEQLVRLHPGEADAAARAAASAAAPEGHLPPPPPDPALPPALAVLGDAAVGAPCDDRHDGIV